MEFLFTNQIASLEAIILFGCIAIIFSIYAYDFYQEHVRGFISAFFPKRSVPTLEGNNDLGFVQETSPLQASEDPIFEKDTSEDKASPGDVNPDVKLDNPILYEEDGSEILPEKKEETEPNVEEVITPIDDTEFLGDPLPEISSNSQEQEGVSESTTPSDEQITSESRGEETPQEEILPIKGIGKINRYDALHKKNEEPDTVVKEAKKHRPDKREKLIEIINSIKTLIARGQQEDARALIVSGLALDKDNRELNILMAGLYERDRSFKKAEYILKDIAIKYPDDIEILTHLATDLAMQGKYDVSYELYKRILVLGDESEETLYTLIHLASEMSLPLDVTLYARAYLKQYPHNPEILWLYAQSQITNGERKAAVETLIKLKNLTPYNQEIADLIQKLVTEEELAGNFGGEKI